MNQDVWLCGVCSGTAPMYVSIGDNEEFENTPKSGYCAY